MEKSMPPELHDSGDLRDIILSESCIPQLSEDSTIPYHSSPQILPNEKVTSFNDGGEEYF